jgi:hypothetical protein
MASNRGGDFHRKRNELSIAFPLKAPWLSEPEMKMKMR